MDQHQDGRNRSGRQRALDRLRTVDPGRARTRAAVRALVASALTGATTLGLLSLAGLGTAPVSLAVLLGLLGVIVVPPGPPRAFLPIVGGAGAVGAVLASLAPSSLAGWLLSLVATVVGAWLGRWGAVGRAAGFVSFLAVVLGLRVGLVPSDALASAGSVLVAVGAVAVTVRWVVPDRPDRRARGLASDLASHLSLLVDAADRLVAAGPGGRRQRRLRLRLVAVQETATLLDTAMDDLEGRAVGPECEAPVDDVRRAVLDIEALADHVAWSALTVSPDASDSERERLLQLLRDARVRTRAQDPGAVDEPLVPRLAGRDDRFDEVVPRLGAALARLRTATASLGELDRGRPSWGLEAPVGVRRVVVQAALAGAVALGLGLLLSPEEWYWSLIGAYIVVTTTTSRGAGLRKAAERILGTAVGVVAGLGVAVVLPNDPALLVSLVVVLAAMVWVFQRSYVVFTFALTIAVALVYEVLGILTPEVLALRLAQTALGATAAAVVVWFVLPVPTRRTVDGAVQGVLAALASALDMLDRSARIGPDEVRAVDRAISSLREVVAPVASGLPGGGGSRVRGARLLATALRVRVAALSTATADREELEDGELAALDVLRSRLRTVRRHLDGHDVGSDDAQPFPDGDGELYEVLRAVDDRLVGYASSRGVTLRADPGGLAAGSPRRLD